MTFFDPIIFVVSESNNYMISFRLYVRPAGGIII